jgi:hypothetical protein
MDLSMSLNCSFFYPFYWFYFGYLLDNNNMTFAFKASVAKGSAAGFSNIPGASKYTISLGQQIASRFKKEQDGPKPVKPATPPTATNDPAPVKPPKPMSNKGKDASTADVEEAVSKGFITPEEATGGEWGKDMGLSKTYQRKFAANAAGNGGTNIGKQFTGVRAGQAIPDQSQGAMNYDKAPDSRPPSVNLDDVK